MIDQNEYLLTRENGSGQRAKEAINIILERKVMNKRPIITQDEEAGISGSPKE